MSVPVFLAWAAAAMVVVPLVRWWWQKDLEEALIESQPDRSGYTDAHVDRLLEIKYGENE